MSAPHEIDALRAQFRQGLRLVSAGLYLIGFAGMKLAWIGIRRLFGVAFALILLFEQWGWRPLSDALARLARLAPLAALERQISRLPPYAALVTFALPSALLVPLKLFALYLIANGHAVAAGALFIGAKIVGTAVVARLYQLTSPQLMQIGWVKQAYDLLQPRIHQLHEAIRASWAWRVGRIWKARMKRTLQSMGLRAKARFLDLFGLGRAPFQD